MLMCSCLTGDAYSSPARPAPVLAPTAKSAVLAAYLHRAIFTTDYVCQASCQAGVVQELCESRGGRPELSVLTSLLVSVDVKNY